MRTLSILWLGVLLMAELPENGDWEVAYVGIVPFTIPATRALGAIPLAPAFHEINVRTYVHRGGRDPGVWFFSLDTGSRAAVEAARRLYRLPYFRARMSLRDLSDGIDFSSVRMCVSAGEALPPEIGLRWKERYGVDILDGIGSTEMLHIFLSNYPGAVKYGTTGRPVPGYDIRLIDDDGAVIATKGEMGELQVRGPSSAIMYWNDREKSRDTFLGEWTRSGDKYLQDADGCYVYCGRRDDMLKVGGIYVAPFEVEGALSTHAEVLEAAVVAWPDDDQLIKPKAFVVLKSPDKACDALAQALQDHVKEKLAPYKYPRWIEFRADLPKTATGKIQRFKLRAERATP